MAVQPQPQGGYTVKSLDAPNAVAENLEAATATALAAAAFALPLVTPSAPVTTNTLTINTTSQDETLVITPSGTIAALTITFPADGSSRLGQIVRIVSHQIVSALTIAGSPTLRGTSLTALAVDTLVSFQKIAASTWQRF